jgi:hypothetical protein
MIQMVVINTVQCGYCSEVHSIELLPRSVNGTLPILTVSDPHITLSIKFSCSIPPHKLDNMRSHVVRTCIQKLMEKKETINFNSDPEIEIKVL